MRRQQKGYFSEFSLGDLAILWLLLNTSTVWDEEYFPSVLDVFSRNPAEDGARLKDAIEKELRSRGVLVSGLR